MPPAAPRRSRCCPPATHGWPSPPAAGIDGSGPLPRTNVLREDLRADAAAAPRRPRPGPARRGSAAAPLLRRARDAGAHLHIDMESLDSREAVLELVLDLLDEDEFREGPSSGIVLQAYLRDSPECWRGDRLGAGHARTPPLTVRLVKGAYWDHELVQARQHGWPVPVFEDKHRLRPQLRDSDPRLLAAGPLLRVAIASHNLRSVAHAIAANRLSGGADRDLELQVLRGLGDELQTHLPPQACAFAPTARSAIWSPGWPISCAACSRTPRTRASCPSRRGARRCPSCWPHPDRHRVRVGWGGRGFTGRGRGWARPGLERGCGGVGWARPGLGARPGVGWGRGRERVSSNSRPSGAECTAPAVGCRSPARPQPAWASVAPPGRSDGRPSPPTAGRPRVPGSAPGRPRGVPGSPGARGVPGSPGHRAPGESPGHRVPGYPGHRGRVSSNSRPSGAEAPRPPPRPRPRPAWSPSSRAARRGLSRARSGDS